MNVRSVCAELAISPKTFYKYVARFDREGVDGFYPRSRRPRRSPSLTTAGVEDVVALARKSLIDAGLDGGADSILFWLQDHPGQLPAEATAPSRSTVNRVLARRGLLVAVPQRRPRSRPRRFEAAHPNGRWQMDGYEVALSDGGTATVLHILDDCSRLDIASVAAVSENGRDVWDAFTRAGAEYGLPQVLLTDNGSAFSGRRRGWTSALETNLIALGVKPVTSSFASPGTCGKVERAHKTARTWLAKQPHPATIAELQALLDTYRHVYNTTRRKKHLGGLTPDQRYRLGPKDGPTGTITPPLRVLTATISTNGCVSVDGVLIGVGKRHRNQPATVFAQGDRLTIFTSNHLIAELTLDRTRKYQRQQRVPLPKS
jgi:transposase InsO family protein